MAITRHAPNTVFLGGVRTQINDLAASEAITPGHLIERFNNGGVHRWRKHTGTVEAPIVATEQAMSNLGVDDAYAAGDLVEASMGHRGATFWMLVPSDETIAVGTQLESAGNGTLIPLASGVPLFTAIETYTAGSTPMRIRVETI